MTVKVLIMGLSGSGKTSFAVRLHDALARARLNGAHINADLVREATGNWDFSEEGRIESSKWMAKSAAQILDEFAMDVIIYDTIACLEEQREILDADITVVMGTLKSSAYPDTDAAFQEPNHGIFIESYDEVDEAIEVVIEQIRLITENRATLSDYNKSV